MIVLVIVLVIVRNNLGYAGGGVVWGKRYA